MTRYDNRGIGRNQEISYYDYLQSRKVNHIDQYVSPTILPITFNNELEITKIQHVWVSGDRLWKLSQQYYGLSNYWWLIAWYNQKPTESHYSVGDIVLIPTPLERILSLYNRNR